jgi:acyl-CoA thioesterase FadM
VAIDHLGRSSVRFRFTFHKDGELIAEGQITTVLCRLVEGHGLQSFEIPGPLRDKLLRGTE